MFGFRKSRSGNDAPAERQGLFARLRDGLARTRAGLADGLAGLFRGRSGLDDELLEALEDRLLLADVGMDSTQAILDGLRARARRRDTTDATDPIAALKASMVEVLAPCQHPLELAAGKRPFVLLMTGVNGVGKTTTIGKLAHRFKEEGRSVMLAAGDTFRAAAVEQLQRWGERNSVPVIAQGTGADSASVVYDAFAAARARGVEVLVADTAGRLHSQAHLMEELKKVKRVLAKLDPEAPHETMLVVDASTGQNALSQAVAFHEAVGLTGIAITKLDGTAKGGIIFAIARRLGLPIRFIGVGEAVTDLRPFDAEAFVEALVGDTEA